tara:strand:- start:271 stop:1104 length:834 start_codon:yes stop_codon:yes gene_type:complete
LFKLYFYKKSKLSNKVLKIMNIKEKFFDIFNMYTEKKSVRKKISKTLKKLLPYQIDVSLVRLGEKNDGGYLVPDDLVGIDKNYSAGVGFLTQYEKDLEEKYSIKSNMLDFNEIDKTILPSEASFLKKKLGLVSNNQEISINDWIVQADKDIILKIDIEGDEYASLIDISEENLKKVRILVIEFHDLRNLRNNLFLNFFDKVINKLENYFYVCHLHINNISKIKKIGDFLVPDMIELTFIRKNRVKNFSSKFSILPHELDSKTVNHLKEKFLDKNWYK